MRVKRAVNSRKKKKKFLKAAKGYRGAMSRRYSLAKEQFYRSGAYAYQGRKKKKGDFRRLWITRINAAARNNDRSYNRFMHGLKLANIDINRKMLAEMAVNDKDSFAELVQMSKQALDN